MEIQLTGEFQFFIFPNKKLLTFEAFYHKWPLVKIISSSLRSRILFYPELLVHPRLPDADRRHQQWPPISEHLSEKFQQKHLAF